MKQIAYIEVDDIEKTAKLYINIGEKILNGTEGIGIEGNGAPNYTTFYHYFSGMGGRNVICSHFPFIDYDYATTTARNSVSVNSGLTAIYFKLTNIFTVVEFKSWLAAQYATENNKVKVQYKLAVPTITNLSYTAVKQYYPQTNVYTNATVQPTLEGKFRIIGN